jgi:hypothetical protein
VTKEAATAALREIRHEKAMTTLEAVAMGGRQGRRARAAPRRARLRHGCTPRTPWPRRHAWRMPPQWQPHGSLSTR